MVRAVRTLVTGARGVDGSDLNLPETNQPSGVDARLKARANRCGRSGVRQLRAYDLGAWLSHASDASLRCGARSPAAVRALRRAGRRADAAGRRRRRGSRGAARPGGRDRASRSPRASPGSTRWSAASTPRLRPTEDARRQHVGRLQIVFGESFVVLPVFTPANAADLKKPRAQHRRAGRRSARVRTWFARATRVREGVERLDAALRYADAMGTGEQLNLRVAQLPYQDKDRWVGLPLAGDRPLSSSRFSLVVQSAPSLDVARPLAGLLIDEWVEVVPSASETTGMVFQFDQPNAAPPQSVLLAVPPDLDTGWTLQTLQQVLLETLDLARLRTVDPQTLDQSRTLPAGGVLRRQRDARHGLDRFRDAGLSTRGEERTCLRSRPGCGSSRDAAPPTWIRGLQARIYDPLWLLARQWQIGEFQGEDNGSPAVAQWRGESARFTRYAPGPLAPRATADGQPFDGHTLPLETLVESEPVRPSDVRRAERLRFAADAGRHFLRVLDRQKLSQNYRTKVLAAFPFSALTDDERRQLDSETVAFVEVMGSRVPDGRQALRGPERIPSTGAAARIGRRFSGCQCGARREAAVAAVGRHALHAAGGATVGLVRGTPGVRILDRGARTSAGEMVIYRQRIRQRADRLARLRAQRRRVAARGRRRDEHDRHADDDPGAGDVSGHAGGAVLGVRGRARRLRRRRRGSAGSRAPAADRVRHQRTATTGSSSRSTSRSVRSAARSRSSSPTRSASAS